MHFPYYNFFLSPTKAQHVALPTIETTVISRNQCQSRKGYLTEAYKKQLKLCIQVNEHIKGK